MKLTKLIPVMILFLVLAVSVCALPISIDKVKVDDTIVEPNEVNKLNIERGDELPIDVYFTVSEDLEDVEVLAFISGYEYNYLDPVSDSVGPFDADANVRYHKKLKLVLNDDFEEDSYKLRIIVADRYGDEVIQSFNLKVDVPRHELKIQDVIFNPELNIKAGSALLAQVRLENKGEKAEEDIRVKVSIPELGVSGIDYIDEIEDTDDSEETEEIYLRIPMCAKPGIYEVRISAEYSNGRSAITTTKSVNIEANDMCDETTKPKTTLTVGKQLENVIAGETATYPITITNNLRQAKSYTVSIDAGEWAESVKLTPSSTLLIAGESSETVYVYATTDSGASGAKVLTATVSSAGNVLQQITLTVNITEKPSSWITLTLEAAVIILAILVILVAIIVGYLKLKEDNDDEQSETYY